MPHISPALVALRGWVTAAAVVVAVCALAQLSMFALARYTEVRVERIESVPNQAIVVGQPGPHGTGTSKAANGAKDEAAKRAGTPARAGARTAMEPTDPNTVRSVTDRNLELANSTVTVLGLVSLIVLTLATGLGAAMSSAAAVPGVELSVRAFVWSAAIFGLGLPWADLAGPTMFDGVFCSYATLVAAAEEGASAAIIAHVVVPMLMLVTAGLVGWWFRRGTLAGVILTSLSEVDEAIEREMSIIRERGVGRLNPGARNAEVLQQTISPDRVAVPEAPPPGRPHGVERRSMADRRQLTDSPKRPI
ncbi:MAG: hypothetical protein AB7K52_02930 [Phycisphaerales bacterium]